MVRSARPLTMSVIALPVAGLMTVFFWRFGIWRRLVLRLEWDTLLPTSGRLPVIAQIFAIKWGNKNGSSLSYFLNLGKEDRVYYPCMRSSYAARNSSGIAHVVAVSMGYGHERAAFGLRHLAGGNVLLANAYEDIPKDDHFLWHEGRRWYERISRFKNVPLVGEAVFGVMDRMQEIQPFYPRRDLSLPTLQLKQTYGLIRSKGWMRHLVEKLGKDRKPLVSTFMSPAFAAEEFGYPDDIYVVTCDADVSRGWAPLVPQKSRIQYIAPTGRVAERLKLYGVPERNIHLTGFPLPPENIGGQDAKIALDDLHRRLCLLDPQGVFTESALPMLAATLGDAYCDFSHSRKPLHVAFAVGGAGAQVDVGIQLLSSLKPDILAGRVVLTLVAGTLEHIGKQFTDAILREGLERALATKSIVVLCERERHAYFTEFGRVMRAVDVLITKPSELSFYVGLGIPLIMTEPVGSQEHFNRAWLFQVGAGADMLDARYAHEWLWDWVRSGALARMAWMGYVNAPTHGAYRIEDVLLGREGAMHRLPLVV